MSEKRRIVLNNILNCRDLGGYPSKYGTTQFGRFLRCGVVARPTDEDVKVLEEYGVQTAIDLRGDYEAEDVPSDLFRIKNCDSYHVSLFEHNVANANQTEYSLSEIYVVIAESYKENIAKVLNIIADAKDGVVLYHCFFGKDRTGIISMLLLTIAGVAYEDIITDYQQTYTYILPYINSHLDTLWSSDEEMHSSRPETIAYLINTINEKYGSVMNYIKSTGISEERIEKIRKRFF